MLPLALAWGEGSEMLQPLAVPMVTGLSYSTLVSLVLVPLVYGWLGARSLTVTPEPQAPPSEHHRAVMRPDEAA
jgi:Cu/Ag efflux pump CusA